MAANNDYPIFDGIAASLGDISVNCSVLDGSLFAIKDISALNSGRSVEVGEQRAVGGRIVRETVGQFSAEGSVTFYRSGYSAYLSQLIVAAQAKNLVRGNQVRVGLVYFDIEYKYTPLNDDLIYHRIMRGCRHVGDTNNPSEGTDPDSVEVTLRVREVIDIVDGVEAVLI